MKPDWCRFGRGFVYAARGVVRAVREERNFRFHITVAAYVLGFAPCFALSRAAWAVLVLTLCAVPAAELINSAVERAVDRCSTERHPLAAAAKDMAAAAVLLTALGSVGVGIALFWQPAAFTALWAAWCAAPWKPLVLVLSLIPAVLFVFALPSQKKEN